MEKSNFERIVEVIETLTGPEGCPWDKEQTPKSLCDYLVEECFELVDAVRRDNPEETAEELGDVLFLLLFIGRPEVVANWERSKKEEKREKNRDTGVFASLPGSLPPLLRAYRIHSKAARAGFTWATDADQERKLAEEWEEWQTALA